jgi:hypothetical protein
MTRGRPLAVALAVAAVGATCSRVNRPCPQPRPFPTRAPTRAPSDAPTTAAVEATGARYQVCGGGTTYRIDRAGARALTEAELREIKSALYSATPGHETAGIGGVACPPAKPDLGVLLWIRENTATPIMIAQHVAALAARAGGDPTVHLQVTIHSAPGPRCAPDDPACGPVPYEAACVERTDYHPKGKREIVRARPGRGPCAYDGECRVGGCGNECVPTSLVDRAGTCEGRSGWDNVYCGCVEAKCVWFTTTP